MQKILTTLALAGMALMNAAANEQVLTLTSQAGTVTFNAANGTLLSVQPQGQSSSLLRSGEQGLWQARFQDGSEIDATQFSAGSATNTFSNEWHAADNAWHLIYRSAAIAVTIANFAGVVDAPAIRGAVLDRAAVTCANRDGLHAAL